MASEKATEQFYAVMSNSTQRPGEVLARVSPLHAGKGKFWTSEDCSKVWKMDRQTAEEIISRLHLNQPRIVRYEKAMSRIAAQHEHHHPKKPELPALMAAGLADKMLVSMDAEFIDTGETIELISIGLVRADGKEIYLENADFPEDAGHLADDWLREHVLAKTLLQTAPTDPRIVPHNQIGPLVRDFLLEGGKTPSIWAHYAAYDHVAFSQLFGRMLDIPDGIPKFVMDFRVLQEITGIKPPSQDPMNAHHALIDARWGKRAFAAFGMPFAPFDERVDFALPEPEPAPVLEPE